MKGFGPEIRSGTGFAQPSPRLTLEGENARAVMPKKSVKRGVKGAGGAGNEDGGEAQDEDTFQCTLCMRHLHQDVLIEHFKVPHTTLPIYVGKVCLSAFLLTSLGRQGEGKSSRTLSFFLEF